MISFFPLRKYRDFRLIFISQAVSFMGSMVSYVVVPYHVYSVTKSSFTVGLLGAVQLVPVFLFGLIGGSVADRVDRRKILIYAESIMALGAFALVVNATLPQPSVIVIFISVFISQSASAYHRPSIEAMTQKMIEPQDFSEVAALGSFKYSLMAIVGPALGGWMIFAVGIKGAYLFDALTFVFAVICAFRMGDHYKIAEAENRKAFLVELKEGLRFAKNCGPLAGSYLVDILAMTFAFPIALFPQIVDETKQQPLIGWLYAGMAMGSLLVTVFLSGWVSSLKNRGVVITWAAIAWGLGIFFFGLSFSYMWLAIFFVALAGAGDTVSGLQRRVLWNEIIPNDIRGRIAGLEMISYLSGPLLGNFRAGTMAGFTTTAIATSSGGLICCITVALCAAAFPAFWKYQKA